MEQLDSITNNSIRQSNRTLIRRNRTCQNSLNELKQLEGLLDGIGFLTFGRNFIICNKKVFSLQFVSNALELTMGNIVSCCEYGCIADANTLLRKYRDDAFFYLYLLSYDSESKRGHETLENQKREAIISRWTKGELRGFTISQLFQSVASSGSLKEVIDKYNLEQSFAKIGRKLNDYIHSNGCAYYNQSVSTYELGALEAKLGEIVIDAKYITIVFLFLIIMCAPHLVASEDYGDYIECGKTPPKDSQYWIAPFIAQFIEENISLIDQQCLQYLKENTQMQYGD